MKFIQYKQSLLEWKICGVLLWAVYMALGIFSLLDGQKKMSAFLFLLGLLSFVVFFLSWQEEKKKLITMDEQGISLTVKGKQEWQFRWEDIEKMRSSTKFRHKGVSFVPKDPPKPDLWKVATPYTYDFQLSKEAREALKQYCPMAVEK